MLRNFGKILGLKYGLASTSPLNMNEKLNIAQEPA